MTRAGGVASASCRAVRTFRAAKNCAALALRGASVVPGDYSQRIDHYVVLRTIEDFYGLAPLARHDAAATPITDAFRKP